MSTARFFRIVFHWTFPCVCVLTTISIASALLDKLTTWADRFTNKAFAFLEKHLP